MKKVSFITMAMDQNIPSNRFPFLDGLRGVAVLWMILFHFCYDLNYFKLIAIDFQRNLFWWGWPRVIVFLFLLATGMSMELVYKAGWRRDPYIKRALLLGLWSMVISFVTYFLFPDRFIFFGVLHCILFSSLLFPFLAPFSRVCALLALMTLFLWWIYPYPLPSMHFFKLQFSMDYIPFYPWASVTLLGIFLGGLKAYALPFPSFPGRNLLLWLGHYSLWIYLLHQPVLFGLVMLVKKSGLF